MAGPVLLAGGDRLCGSEVAAALHRQGFTVLEEAPDGGGLLGAVLVSDLTLPGSAFDTIGDDAFGAAASSLCELVETFQAAIPRLAPGGALVFLGTRGLLGGWDGAHAMAASAACAAMVRSVAMEFAPRGLRANMVAAEFADRLEGDPSARTEAAAVVAFLLSPEAGGVTGETVLVNRGASLAMRQARRR